MLIEYQVSVHAADVKKVFAAYSFEVHASTAADLKEVSPVSCR